MLEYTLVRRDALCGAYGYVERQHHTLAAALRTYPWARQDVVLCRTTGFLAKGSTLAIRDRDVIQIAPPCALLPMPAGQPEAGTP